MKHHVLLGLILGLLATAKLGGQVLFNVEVNPSAKTVTITPNANAHPSWPAIPYLSEYTSLRLSDGITLINLFPGSSTATTPATGSPVSPTLNVFGFAGDPDDPAVPQDYLAEPPATFTRYSIYQDIQVSTLPNDPLGNPANSGKNLNLFNPDETFYYLFDIRFSKPDSPSSLVINFLGEGDLPATSSSYTGPHNIYAGINTVFPAQAEGIAYNTFLGTYTITVVPEPSTYAAIAGGLGLVVAVLRRRRQRARATAA